MFQDRRRRRRRRRRRTQRRRRRRTQRRRPRRSRKSPKRRPGRGSKRQILTPSLQRCVNQKSARYPSIRRQRRITIHGESMIELTTMMRRQWLHFV
jgi:hypothetical protein